MIIDNLNITPLLPSTPIVPSGKTRVWIHSGQSNAVGQGLKSDLFAANIGYGNSNSNVKIWNGSAFVDINPGVNTNYIITSTTFGAEPIYSKLTRDYFGSGTDYIIKLAWNGEPIKNWLVGGSRRNTLVNSVNAALDVISPDKNNYTCVFVWDQGETVLNQTDADVYATDFAAMITDFRASFDVRSLPVILRKMRYDVRGNFPYIKTVVAAQKTILTSVANSHLINGDGYYLKDNIHFEANSLIELGKKIFLKALPLWD